jgi:hypothetical protein
MKDRGNPEENESDPKARFMSCLEHSDAEGIIPALGLASAVDVLAFQLLVVAACASSFCTLLCFVE